MSASGLTTLIATLAANPETTAPTANSRRRRPRTVAPSRGEPRGSSRLHLGDLRLARRPVHLDLDGEHLVLDPVGMPLEEVGVVAREADDDPVRELEARVLAHLVQAADQVEDAAFAPQLVVERRVELDADAAVTRRRP